MSVTALKRATQAKERICAGLEAGSTVARPAADIPCDGAELEGLRGPG